MEGRKRVTAGRHGNIAEQVRECTPSADAARYCQIDHVFSAIAIVSNHVAINSPNYFINLLVVVLYSGTPKTKYLFLAQRDATRVVKGAIGYSGHDVSPNVLGARCGHGTVPQHDYTALMHSRRVQTVTAITGSSKGASVIPVTWRIVGSSADHFE